MTDRRDVVIHLESASVNISPDGFRLWAKQYLQCRQDFRHPDGFSPVPYFLLCRAIELFLKAHHLESKRQSQVKTDFGHNLVKSYNALDPGKQILSDDELQLLSQANDMYKDKGFEYFPVLDAIRGFNRAPNLVGLEAMAIKLAGNAG